MEKQYKTILKSILKNGVFRNDRTGVGSYSIFSKDIIINMNDGFPILTGRFINEKIFKTEFLWFINGETNIKRFKDNNIKIWDNWADENGDLGFVYGFQMLNFNNNNKNQLDELILSLTNNKDSRRHIITLWNPLQIHEMSLPPCYLYFQFFVENDKLNLFVLQRSGDMFLGIPYDIALFAQFLLYISEKVNLSPNIINLKIIDAHIYKNQIKAVKEYLKQPIFDLPTFTYKNNNLNIINYKTTKIITSKVAI